MDGQSGALLDPRQDRRQLGSLRVAHLLPLFPSERLHAVSRSQPDAAMTRSIGVMPRPAPQSPGSSRLISSRKSKRPRPAQRRKSPAEPRLGSGVTSQHSKPSISAKFRRFRSLM
jgi:hypothetical protein